MTAHEHRVTARTADASAVCAVALIVEVLTNVYRQADLTGDSKRSLQRLHFVFDKPRASWLAGQHFMFLKPHFPFDLRGVTRVFTISSAPEEETLCFTTRYFDDQSSSFKRALFRMQPGERLWAYGPSPIFDYFRALDTGRHYVFLTGGIGITPVRATLKHHAAVSGSLTATLLYANRDHEVIFKEEIELPFKLP